MIIDASVASHWFADTEFSKAADPFRSSSSLIAPGFLLVETANVLYKQSRAGRIDAGHCGESVEVLRESMAELVPDVQLLPQAIDLAIANNHPVYDCLYLALAMERRVQLVTADRQLARRAEALGIAVDMISAT
jgi:predicted nucleic acid-binding protein